MSNNVISSVEKERMNELFSLDILDSQSETQYNELVELASTITDCPVSLISLVDSNRQWFKASHGLDATETPRDISFCSHAIEAKEDLFMVEDASEDPRFANNPLVTEDPNIKFYAGRKLTTSNGYNIGTLCVIDTKRRTLSKLQQSQLNLISKQVVYLIESRKRLADEKQKSIKAMAFISSISHEIRTPLTSVIGYADVISNSISKNENKEKINDYIETIKHSATHLESLVGDVLDFSKMGSGKVMINNESISLSMIMKQISSLLRVAVDKNNVDFKLTIDKSSPKFITTDPTLLKQIVINLASNAIKFTKDDQVSINVKFNKDNNLLIIDIKDNGIGMTEEEALRLFNPFEQANSTIQKNFKGTGLGLAISKELAEKLGGDIKLTSSKLNIGSEFSITIPVGALKAANQLVRDTKDIEFKDLQIKKILVIDDVKENRFLLGHFLSDLKVEIVEASDGEDALSKYDNSFDVILVDMHLPDMSGVDLFKKLFKDSKANQRFVAFTASIDSEEKQKCIDLGFDGFLSKPFNKESLIQSLSN